MLSLDSQTMYPAGGGRRVHPTGGGRDGPVRRVAGRAGRTRRGLCRSNPPWAVPVEPAAGCADEAAAPCSAKDCRARVVLTQLEW
ncbi:hypothetical protein ACFQZZ_13345 [Nocardia sp. GCM10030253]|uniref:hypothetical protein n=1 Tax=Nocardia sp. GCM10030253 TaxID=3273404 RepID=UPI003640456D